MGGYLLLALGLINLRYQTGKTGILANSLILIIPGALLLVMTLFAAGKNVLHKKAATAIVMTLGGLLVVYAFLN